MHVRLWTWGLVLALFLAGYSQGSCQEGAVPAAGPALQSGPQFVAGSLEGTLDPDLYVLGAGDILTIGFWGDVNRVETLTVNPDGDILVAPVGPISVDGLTLSEVRSLIKSELAAYYRPSILSVSLVAIRTFQVHVVGMVEMPAAVEVNGVTRVSQAVALAGGLREGSSRRNIMVRRGDDVIPVDLTRYLRLGDNSLNPFLKDGDVVLVPYARGPVQISGSVFHARDYEFVEGESVADIIALAGGFRPEAYTDTMTLERFDEDDPTVSEALALAGEPALLESFKVELGDRIFIRAIPDWHRDAQVTATGEVKFPGVYVIDEGRETLTDLIQRAGGLTEDASLAEARLIRGLYANRAHPVEREVATIMEVDITEYWKDTDLTKTLSRELKGRVALDYEALFLGEEEAQDLLLMDGDVIDIPRATRLVRVAGQVNNPGLVVLMEGGDYRHYISEAGGYASKADKKGTVLIRSGGGQRIKAGGREVRAGDIVWVPKRPDYSWWEVTKGILTVAAQIATVWLVIDSINRN